MNNPEDYIDEALAPLAEFIEVLADSGGQIRDPEGTLSMSVESLKLDLPVELDIANDEAGKVVIGGGPPTQQIETTVLPVFHQLKLTIVSNNGQ